MKKIFVFLLLMVVSFTLKAQYPITQNLGSNNTLIRLGSTYGGALKGNLIQGVYADTTEANTGYIDLYPGAIIFSTGNATMYVRNAAADGWIALATGLSAINIYTSDGTLTGNRTLAGVGNSLTFSGLSDFLVEDATGEIKLGTSEFNRLRISSGFTAFISLDADSLLMTRLPQSQLLSTDSVLVRTADFKVKTRAVSSIGSTYTAGNGLTLSGSQFKLGGTLTEPTIITGSGTNLLKLDGYTSANVGYLGIGTDFGYLRFGDGGAFSPTYENEIYGGVSQIGLKTTGDIYLDAGDIYTIGIPTVSSTTGRKVALIDTATGKVERIDPSALSGGSQTLQQVLTAGSTLTTNNTIASGANSLTFSNDRGSVVFDNSSQPLVKLNGTGSAALFQADSAGINKMRLTSRGQLALGDSVNLSIFIGHNSGLNYSPQGAVGNPPGRWNNALGTNALSSLTIGNDNVAIGTNAVRFLTTGGHNIGIGTAALNGVTTGGDNVGIGVDVMASTNGQRNVAVGSYSQFAAQGSYNTSVGYGSLYSVYPVVSNTGEYNTGIGYNTLNGATTGSTNVGVGALSLERISTGGANTAIGMNTAPYYNGDNSLFIGNGAGFYNETESNSFYLHTLTSGITDEATGKAYSMFYGQFANAGANQLRMNGKMGINKMPDSTFDINGSLWANGKVRFSGINTGIPTGAKRLLIDADGNVHAADTTTGGGSGVTTVGTFSGSSQTNGASISGSTITFGPADATNPGMVSTGTQTWAGTKELRWKARVGSTTSSATPTINTDNYDIYKLTAQAADITSFTTNLSGTPNDGDILEIQITGTAARAITWGSSFVSTTVTLPTTTTSTNTLTVILQYYTTSSYGNNKWHCVNYY